MNCLGRDVIPFAWLITTLVSIHNQNKFALGNDANVVGVVGVGWNFCSGRITGEENVAVLGGEFIGVEGAVEFG